MVKVRKITMRNRLNFLVLHLSSLVQGPSGSKSTSHCIKQQCFCAESFDFSSFISVNFSAESIPSPLLYSSIRALFSSSVHPSLYFQCQHSWAAPILGGFLGILHTHLLLLSHISYLPSFAQLLVSPQLFAA